MKGVVQEERGRVVSPGPFCFSAKQKPKIAEYRELAPDVTLYRLCHSQAIAWRDVDFLLFHTFQHVFADAFDILRSVKILYQNAVNL